MVTFVNSIHSLSISTRKTHEMVAFELYISIYTIYAYLTNLPLLLLVQLFFFINSALLLNLSFISLNEFIAWSNSWNLILIGILLFKWFVYQFSLFLNFLTFIFEFRIKWNYCYTIKSIKIWYICWCNTIFDLFLIFTISLWLIFSYKLCY